MFVLVFNDLNFFDWSKQVQFHLGVLDLDMIFHVRKPILLLMLVALKRNPIIKLGKGQTDLV